MDYLPFISAASQACVFPLEAYQTNRGYSRPGGKKKNLPLYPFHVNCGLKQVYSSLSGYSPLSFRGSA